MRYPKYLIFFLIILGSIFEATGNTLTSTFSNDLQGWEPLNPWHRSSLDGLSEGDFYMRMPVGINPGNKGSKLIAFNPTNDWTGNFLEKGVIGVSLNFVNWSQSDPVYLRIAISNMANPQQSGGTWWASSTPIYFAPESGWGSASFQINESGMHRVGNLEGELGLDTFEDTVRDINGFRILSSTLGYGAIGDSFYGVVGMDNIQLITIPEPGFTSLVLAIFLLTYISRRVL